MAKKEIFDESNEARLKNLREKWWLAQESLDFSSVEPPSLSLPDLRFLLENHEPLRDLIRSIVQDGLEKNLLQLQEEEVEKFSIENASCNNSSLVSKSTPEEFVEVIARLKEEKNRYENEIKNLTDELNDVKEKLAAVQLGKNDIEALEIIKFNPLLAECMNLNDMPDNKFQALAKVVAVLSQIDNITRLWNYIKDRCESENRSASEDELSVLNFALDWHNYNWSKLPFCQIHAVVGSRYNYELHHRSRHFSNGEEISFMYLPGIKDGSGKLIKKALVATK